MKETNYTPNVKAKITWMNEDQTAPKKATASITIADSFKVHGFSIVEGSNGLFISNPQRQIEHDGNRRYADIAHPISSEMRKAVHDAIFNAYSQTMAMSQQYRDGFQNNQKSSESMSSQGDATEEELPFEEESDEDEPEEPAEDEDSVPIIGQMM